ncbi:hypothetical protein [Streptomyces sp. NPDC006552]|uniref:hypothetical protein n=1 Tax=Streptomyces sp. NPDC006552 TaxID=3157179 RepID=UPI0033A5C933
MSTLADTTANTRLIAAYAESVDTGDLAGVNALFADGTSTGGGGCSRPITSLSNTRKSMAVTVDIAMPGDYGFSCSRDQQGAADTDCPPSETQYQQVQYQQVQDGAVVEFRSQVFAGRRRD